MTVRAKLYVSQVTRQASTPDAVQVTLAAVTRGEDNKTWAEATPCATFTMTIQNPSAAVQFVLGQEFYVDFEPVGTVATLADDHEFELHQWQKEQVEKGRSVDVRQERCQHCGAKGVSHEQPIRGLLAEWRP